jgi:hypothetical protein
VQPAADPDPALDDLDLRVARDKAAGGDWTAGRDVIAAAGADWERRGHRIWALSEVGGGEVPWLDAWLAATPDDPTAITFQAATLTRRARKARGAAAAANTSAGQFRAYRELMARAEDVVLRAVEMSPDDPVPCVELMVTCFATGDRDGFADALAEARRRDAANFDVNTVAVNFACEKWFGSHRAMFTTAREAAEAAPAGSASVALPLQAHFEFLNREYFWGGTSAESLVKCRDYFKRSVVQRELDVCAAKWHAAGPPTGARAMICHNWFAAAYVLSDRREDARRTFDTIGPHVAGYAWSYFFRSRTGGFLAGWAWANRARLQVT